MNRFLFFLLISFACLGFTNFSLAKGNEGDYLIEVIIFSQNPGINTSEKPGKAYVFQPYENLALKLGTTPTWNKLATSLGPAYEPVEKELIKEARAIRNSKEYKLLLHEAWKMYLEDEATSLDILIEGGDYYSLMPELVGKIKLSVARYLHLQTALYLNNFINQPMLMKQKNIINNQISASSLLNSTNLNLIYNEDTSLELPEDSQLITGNYIIESSASMQQKRRMRSNELHFIDSPYLGLLIKIQRYKPSLEELKEQEEAEEGF